jgi:hypothetical protein
MSEEKITVLTEQTTIQTAEEGGDIPEMYAGYEGVSEMMRNMARDMSAGAERSRRRSIQAAVNSLRAMNCGRDKMIEWLVSGYGFSEEEASAFLGSD